MSLLSLFKRKQWQQLQADGSWLNVRRKDGPGTYRFITFTKGVPTLSQPEDQ